MGVIRHCWISWLMCKTMHFMLGGQYIRVGIELGSQLWSCTSKQIRFMKPKLLYLTNQWETNIIGLQVLPMVVKWLDGCISEVLLVIYIGLKSLSLSIKGDQIVNLKNFILTLYIKNQNPRSKLMQNLFFFLRRPLYVFYNQTQNFVSKGHHELPWRGVRRRRGKVFMNWVIRDDSDCGSWVGVNLANEFVQFRLKL